MLRLRILVLALFAVCGAASLTAFAQAPATGGSKIYCWKNKQGKTECGDAIPLEYQDAPTRELNKRGITVRQTEGATTPEQKKAQQEAAARKKVEEQRAQEQKRKDKALLDTFSDEKEIDLMRSREIQAIESTIDALQITLKNATDRLAESNARTQQYVRNKRPVPEPVQEEIGRIGTEKAKIESQIAQKRKEIVAINQRYDEMKKRYLELKGGSTGQANAPAAGAQPTGGAQATAGSQPPAASRPAPAKR